jgi:hypothetical protein
MDFSISILLQNTIEDFNWLIIFVCGPIPHSKKVLFFNELKQTQLLGYDSWLIGGDFNNLTY